MRRGERPASGRAQRAVGRLRSQRLLSKEVRARPASGGEAQWLAAAWSWRRTSRRRPRSAAIHALRQPHPEPASPARRAGGAREPHGDPPPVADHPRHPEGGGDPGGHLAPHGADHGDLGRRVRARLRGENRGGHHAGGAAGSEGHRGLPGLAGGDRPCFACADSASATGTCRHCAGWTSRAGGRDHRHHRLQRGGEDLQARWGWPLSSSRPSRARCGPSRKKGSPSSSWSRWPQWPSSWLITPTSSRTGASAWRRSPQQGTCLSPQNLVSRASSRSLSSDPETIPAR
jgi:hypothetical protein